MSLSASDRRRDARAIWDAAVAAVRPGVLMRAAFAAPGAGLHDALSAAPRILVVGAGKAGAAMSAALEEIIETRLDFVEGAVNVPDDCVRPLRAIRLHAARPAGSNFPTEAGVSGAERMLELLAGAGPADVCLCLLSGGGSALLPAPVHGVSLADKLAVTRLLHECGATINEMNTVRKHLSRTKGGRLASAFTGRALHSLIISDVIGDPLDVIASGPTAADPTTYADALRILDKYRLTDDSRDGRLPDSVLRYLRAGKEGKEPETPKQLPSTVCNRIIGNNRMALDAAEKQATVMGYRTCNLGPEIDGATRDVAKRFASLVQEIGAGKSDTRPPVCILSGGETTVTLPQPHGKGGRNQEFVLSMLILLGQSGLRNVTILSGGSDGEDGPTDAAGAVADVHTLAQAVQHGLDPGQFLARADAYSFFDATGCLIKTGLTHTNVMDVRVILIHDAHDLDRLKF